MEEHTQRPENHFGRNIAEMILFLKYSSSPEQYSVQNEISEIRRYKPKRTIETHFDSDMRCVCDVFLGLSVLLLLPERI